MRVNEPWLEEKEDAPRPLVEHLGELRRRLLWSIGTFVGSLLAWLALPSFQHSFAMRLLEWSQASLLPPGLTLVFLDPLEPLMTVMKVGAYASVLTTLPVVVFHVYRFMAPGVPVLRARGLWTAIWAALGLMGLGVWLSWAFILPTTFAFFVRYGQTMGVTAQLSMGRFVGLAGGMVVMFSLPFLLPLVMVGGVSAGFLTVERLRASRRFVYLGIAVVSAVATPDPTLFSMLMLTISLCVLFEVGIVACVWIGRNRGERPEEIAASREEGRDE